MALTALAATKAQPKEKPYKMADKDGLYLQINPNGKKYWRFKYRFLGKEKLLAVGVFPEVSLGEARDAVIEARKLLRQGADPSAKRKEDKREALNSAENTFYLVAKDWHSKHLKKWTKAHAAAIWRRLELHIMPHLGQRPINQIKPLELLDVIRKIENKGATEMSRRVLQSCSAVFTYALILSIIPPPV